MMDTSDAWIRERTGIRTRHIAAATQGTVDLAEPAARAAIAAANIEPADIDLIVFATSTPDLVFPNCGVLLQQRLGCPGGAAFSVEAACSGFVYALSIADKFVKAGEARHALVVGAKSCHGSPTGPTVARRCCSPMAPERWCSRPVPRPGILDPPARGRLVQGPAVLSGRGGSQVRCGRRRTQHHPHGRQ